MARLTLRAYARHRGCTLSMVQRAISSGRIKRGSDGKIDAASADRSWALRTTQDTRKRVDKEYEPDPTGDAIQKARAIQLSFQARMAELEFQRRSKTLVPVEDVRRAAFDSARRVRNLIGNMGDRIGPVVVGLSVHEAIKLINDEAARILDELAVPSTNGNHDEQRR